MTATVTAILFTVGLGPADSEAGHNLNHSERSATGQARMKQTTSLSTLFQVFTSLLTTKHDGSATIIESAVAVPQSDRASLSHGSAG